MAARQAARISVTLALIRLGCVPGLPLQRIQAFLGLLYHRDPEREVATVHLPTAELIRRVRAGDLDLALLHAVSVDGTLDSAILFAGEPLAAFVPADTRYDGDRRALSLPPRAADPLLHDWLAVTLERAGQSFGAVHEIEGSDPRDLLFAIAEGRGTGIGPRSLPRSAGEVGTLVAVVPLGAGVTMPDTVVAWRRDGPPKLAALVQGIARELSSSNH